VRVAATKGKRTETHKPRGWFCYDGDCGFCAGLVHRYQQTLDEAGFDLKTLQDPEVARALNLMPGAPPTEMYVRTTDGDFLRGADAILYAARAIPWMRPLWWYYGRLPRSRLCAHFIYRWIARHRHGLFASKEPRV